MIEGRIFTYCVRRQKSSHGRYFGVWVLLPLMAYIYLQSALPEYLHTAFERIYQTGEEDNNINATVL